MATSIRTFNPSFHSAQGQHRYRGAALALAVAAALIATPAAAGQYGSVYLLTRPDGNALTVYEKDGRRWVEGTPGQEYAIRVCNTSGARVLAVTSVDGVNVVSGETASPAQSGYVLDAYQCTDINGWRKNLASVNAFYFTELPDSYAARTGRPDNVGVIGVAFFRERPQPVAWQDAQPKVAAALPAEPIARQESAAGGAAAEGRLDAARKSASDFANAAPPAAPMAKIGTGYGRNESSYVQTTRFERDSATPNETIAFHYDRRDNLVAMGILPPPAIARSSNPFPAWTPRFVPAPPLR
jgi:hypothetical protein